MGGRRPLHSLGLWMLAPVLLEYATEEQKLAHLPGIARGERRWCQGYSEPGAGSDLASLQTRAVRDPEDGDHYIVDGAKVWTSHANLADFMFCLVRTDPTVAKHDGISFVLIDMTSPGISVRPIQLISGSSPFCETRFEHVRVPVRNRIGREGGGWTIAKRLLEHERSAISMIRDAAPEETESVVEMARRRGVLGDPILRDQIIQTEIEFLANRLTLRRARETGARDLSSMFKLLGTELSKRKKELRVAICGYQGLGWEGLGFADDELQITREWLRSRANSIEGGTSEIQLNIIAKRVLGLPD